MQPRAGVTTDSGESGVARRAASDVPHDRAALRATIYASPPTTSVLRSPRSWLTLARLLPRRLTSDRGFGGDRQALSTPSVKPKLDPTFWWGPFIRSLLQSRTGRRWICTPALVLLFGGPLLAEEHSLLASLLRDAPALSATLTNIAGNLGTVEADFALAVERDFAEMTEALTVWADGRRETVAGVGARVTELQADAGVVLGGLLIDVNAVATTAVGSLQAADMTGAFDAGTLTQRIEAATGATALAVETYGGVSSLVALQNVSINSGSIVAQIDLQLADVNARIGTMNATAIGALQNGALQTTVDLSATVQGQMGEISALASATVAALVGS